MVYCGREEEMKVLIKEPGKPWQTAEVENALEALQGAVGGYIETLTINAGTEPLVLIMDEEGRLNDKPYNMTIGGVDLVGTLLLCGKDGDEFTDVPDWVARGLAYHKSAR